MLDFLKVLGDRINRKDLYAESCLFIKEDSSYWEEGILIDSGIGGLLDINGEEIGDITDVEITNDFLIDSEN